MPSKERFLSNPEFGSTSRQKIIKYLVIAVAVMFLVRLSFLQIIKGGDYRLESEAQGIKENVIEPFRGNMYDRNNLLMVHNEPSFSVTLTPNDFSRDRLELLVSLLKTDTTSILKILDKNKYNSPFQPVKIARDVDFEIVSTIEEYSDILSGIEIITESKRLYNFNGNFSHFLGYTREISAGQLETMKYYKQGEIIGQNGIESEYDAFLRGQKGIRFIGVTRKGEKLSSFNSGLSDVQVSNGFDLHLAIDLKLQERAEELLKDKRGAVVAIDPNNGEVIILASKPDYDPRKFSGRVPAEIYNALQEDPGKPLYNRALQSIYPPGSTWKMIVALAGLNEGLINDKTLLTCPGSYTFGNRSFACHAGHAHGSINVVTAIHASCNVFFYQLGVKLGIERMMRYAQMFGFGDKTYIDIPNEGRGILPTVEWLNRRFGNNKYPKGAIVNFGIGQGEISVTPLQMAVYCSALANKGTVFQPHIVRSINNNILHKIQNVDYGSKQININPSIFDIVRLGMFKVVNEPGGTATSIKLPDIVIAGKTGTAQNPHGQDHSWFICFAPYDKPQIAMCVIVENAGFGSTVAAPIAQDLLIHYLRKDHGRSVDSIQTKLKDTLLKKNVITKR